MKKDIGIFTIVKNEKFFTKKWIEYYSKFFDLNDMYILDHESIDGSTNNLPVNTIKISNEQDFHIIWLMERVREFSEKLLKDYKYFFYVDADELIITKDGSNFREYLDKEIHNNRNCFIATGYNIVHNKEKEPPFDYSKSILSQRKYYHECSHYNKPFMADHLLYYNSGLHTAGNETWYSDTSRNDPNLLLMHCKLYDFDESVNRYKERFTNLKSNFSYNETLDQAWVRNNEVYKFIEHHLNQAAIDNYDTLDNLLKYDYTNLF